uniref:Uncharacterized protein n=1 Tax=Lactuca sativa TaxID=4236 RepID=A0A9R1X265_LACSA|nr:hypothetical protein LSAT_V11C700370240 [Lactuca sativa]
MFNRSSNKRSYSSSSLIYFYFYELQNWCSASVGMLLLCEPHGPHEVVLCNYSSTLMYSCRDPDVNFLGVDPLIYQRSTVIIPGLLRTMNRYEVEVCQLKM